ncbi:MAG: hypothetical protein JRE43_12140 [Deltaproteobacteria bacterium]|jgi:hypothetical protein|nr:hypothetical protein [Deltaproteobacteria bacterium]
MPDPTVARLSQLPCCPELDRKPVCDELDFRYSLPYRAVVGGRQTVPVEVVLHFRLRRCSGPLVLGDLLYTTTLLPGEKVRLFTSDRNSRWSFDSQSSLAYRNETTTTESFYTWRMARAMSDLTINESGTSVSSFDEDWSQGGGGGGFNFLGIIKIGGGGSAGSYDSDATSSFARNLSRHAESFSSQTAAGVRAKSSVSIGEVEQRAHAEGESESHFESSTRQFSNPNRCHAVTYLFHQINKTQLIQFDLVAIRYDVNDPAAPTEVDPRPDPDLLGNVAVRPQAVLATSTDRLERERIAREAAVERFKAKSGLKTDLRSDIEARLKFAQAIPINAATRNAALKQVHEDLAKANLIEKASGKPTKSIIAELSWRREELLPTPGILVRGCLDECNTCEDARKKQIELELARMELENQLLARQIELLDKSQEYRCCPAREEEDGDD